MPVADVSVCLGTPPCWLWQEAKAAKDEVVKLQKHVRSLLWTASNGTTSDDANDSSSSPALLNGHEEAAEAPPSGLDRDQVLVMAEQVVTQI